MTTCPPDYQLIIDLCISSIRHLFASKAPKVFQSLGVLCSLTWTCASRDSGVPFFHILTSKSGLRPSAFLPFDLQMCFAPRGRAIFRIQTSKIGSTLVFFVPFELKIRFTPQQRAIFQLSSSSHPPLYKELTCRPSGNSSFYSSLSVFHL